MTPTEQDKELREKLNSLFESVFSQGVRAGKDVATETYEDFDAWHKKGELDDAMQLITADRKRVALEARIETVMYIDSMLRFENIPLHPVQSESLKQYLRQLEAQQEKL